MTVFSLFVVAGIYLSLKCAASASLLPSISIQPCTIPLADSPINLCCKTKNIHSATVLFSYTSENGSVSGELARIKYPCQVYLNQTRKYNVSCQMEGSQSIYRLTTKSSSDAIGVWTCEYYAGVASYRIKDYQILNKDSGFVFVNVSQNATLRWETPFIDSSFQVYSPKGDIILQVENKTVISRPNHDDKVVYIPGTSEVVLITPTLVDNGTYVYSYKTGTKWIRNGVTLIILDKLDKPQIIPTHVTAVTQTNIVSGTLQCSASPKGAGPYFYTPDILVSWINPTENAGYNATQVDNSLVVSNVDCKINQSQPVFCQAKEASSAQSELQFYFPHQLCYYYTTTTSVPASATTVSPDKNFNTLLSVVISLFLVLCFVIVGFMIFRRRSMRHGVCDTLGACCSECYTFLRGCCRRTLCKRCIKDDYMDSDSDLDRYISTISRRDESSEWSQIANVYTRGDAPVIRIPRLDENQNGRPALPPVPIHYNNGLEIGDEDSAETSTDDNTPNLSGEDGASLSGAEGVDRNAIIKEVESALKSLKQSLSSTEQQVQVTRNNLEENLMDIYADPTIVDTSLHITILGEEGSDWGGVTRDVFTTFWNKVSSIFFQGDLVHVPYLPPHKLEDMYKFRLMGRILSHSTAILGYIPITIAKSSIMVTVLDTTEISEDVLLEDFLLFLGSNDRVLLQDAMHDFNSLSEESMERLQSIFFRFDMGCVLREETFVEQVLKMAKMELVIKPRSLCEAMRQGIPAVHFDRFWVQLTLEHLSVLYDRLKPTPYKVLACLRPESLFLSEKRQQVYTYFKNFIRSLSETDLEKILQFMTGQSCVPKQTITVQFSNLTGAERRPIAHTCSFLIEIPETYESFEEFNEEMTHLLNSDILHFDIH